MTYAKWHFQTKGWWRDKITEMGATCGRVQVYRAWGPSFNLQREKKNKMLYPKKVGVALQETWESLFLRGLRQKIFMGGDFWWAFCPRLKRTGDGFPEPGSYFYVLLVSYWATYGEMLADGGAQASRGESRTHRERPVFLSTESWGESSGQWWGRATLERN